MTSTLFTAAALALAATVGIAVPVAAATPPDVPIRATYNTATQRYCVRATTLQDAIAIGGGIYRRECLTIAKWRMRGVSFAPAPRPGRLANR